MTTIRYSKDFLKDLNKLPKNIKKILKLQEEIFTQNRFDRRLHIKKIKGGIDSHSFRITRNYRVIFYFRDEEAIFFKIGHRKDIYK